MAKFDVGKVENTANEMASVLSNSGLSYVEMAYTVGAVLRGLGEAAYDKQDVEYSSVLTDYKTSPTFPAALIIHADQIHYIHELFIQEVSDPQKNVDDWMAHEESISDRGSV